MWDVQPSSTIRTCLKNSDPKGPFKCYVTQLGVGGWLSAFLEKSVTEVYGSTLLALRGGGSGSDSQEKSVS